jgi:hypothetical protein
MDDEEVIAVLEAIHDALSGIEDPKVEAARHAAQQAAEGDPEGATRELRATLAERAGIEAEQQGPDLP